MGGLVYEAAAAEKYKQNKNYNTVFNRVFCISKMICDPTWNQHQMGEGEKILRGPQTTSVACRDGLWMM